MQSLGLAVAQVALAEDFHADHGFAGGFHFTQDADHGLRVGVHVRADGVDAGEIDFDPGRLSGGAQGFDAVAGTAVGADDSLLLGFREDVHHAFETLGPIGLGEAVHEANVEVVGAEFAAEAVEIGAGGGGIASPSLGEDGDSVARNVLECFGDVRMTSVSVGSVEETETVIVTIEKEIREALKAERSLVGMMAGANGAGAHSEATGGDAGAAESDSVGG